MLRQPLEERNQITDLANAYGPTSTGRSIPLGQIARGNFVWESGVLWREGRDYAATVQGDIIEGLQAATVTAQLDPLFKAVVRAKMLPGDRIEVAGAVEESSKGQGSIAAGLPIALFSMFTLPMLQLRSFARSILAFVTGLWGIAGIAAALLIFNRPFGFVALLGMIIGNWVILIDQIEQDRAKGVPT